MINAFISGMILAFGLIIPLGVQNIFVFNQGAAQKRIFQALPSVITAFLCDVLLIICAILGVSVIVFNIPWLKMIIYVVGIIFLFYMGWLTWKNHSQLKNNVEPLSAKSQIGFAFSGSLLNPHALIDTIGVIGMNSLHFGGKAKLAYTLACILVSFFWFLGLSILGHYFKKIDKTGLGMQFLNKISAIIIWGVGLYIAWQLAR